MKTREELNALKEEVVSLNKKLAELSEEEVKQVFGGTDEIENRFCSHCGTITPQTLGFEVGCYETGERYFRRYNRCQICGNKNY